MIRRFAFMLSLFTFLALTADEQIVSHREVIPGLAFQADQSMQYSLLTP